MSIEAMKRWLKALEYASTGNRRPELIAPAIAEMSQAIEQAEQAQPVGEIVLFGDHKEVSWAKGKMPPLGSKLYTTPPPRQPEQLTDEQIDAAVKAWFETQIVAGRQPFAKRMRAAFAAAHGIKGEA